MQAPRARHARPFAVGTRGQHSPPCTAAPFTWRTRAHGMDVKVHRCNQNLQWRQRRELRACEGIGSLLVGQGQTGAV